MPLPEPPLVVCLDRVDANTLKINLGGFKKDKYAVIYYIYRINPDKSEELKDSFLANNLPTSYIDDKAFNHATNYYKYYLFGVNKCGLRGKNSYEVNSNPNIPLPPKSAIFYRATVRDENRGVLIEWSRAKEDNFDKYIIQRKKNTPADSFTDYKLIYNRDDTVFVDSSFDVNTTSLCYRILTNNRCGYTSVPSNKGCNIVLKGVSLPFEHQLTYQEYSGWAAGVAQYSILRSNPPDTKFNFVGKNKPDVFTYFDDKLDINYGAHWYKINAIENQSGYSKVSASNQIFLYQKPLLYPPNAFTPNGDELNDSFFTSPIFVKDYHIKIFTRWGELVYESNDKLQHWNGKYRGANSYIGAYIWQVEYTGWDNSFHAKQGFITILK
jgi:gliding motility-associated-like protein